MRVSRSQALRLLIYKHNKKVDFIDGEMWEFIPFNSRYLVSSEGRVFSLKTNKVLIPHKNVSTNDGYSRVKITNKRGKARDYYIHRLMAMCFLKMPVKSRREVHHINNIKTDNRLENIQVLTRYQHFKTHGKQLKRPRVRHEQRKAIKFVDVINHPLND
ncbi:TPA: HNH endonuclease [Listeria monocytogenes]|nr:HNH endonuclease [Listeria monocytogenes]